MFVNYVKKTVRFKQSKLTEQEFNIYKKAVLGDFLKSLNYLENIAYSYLDSIIKNSDVFEVLELFQDITLDDMKKIGKYFVKNAISEFIIYPKDELKNLEKSIEKKLKNN